MKRIVALLIIGICLAGFPGPVICAMSSTNYFIFADSVETGGGLSTGGVYGLQDTAGESPAGFSTSSAYEIRAGYQFMERGYLSLLISSDAIDLGTLSASAVNSDSTTATVTTDSITGYSLSISAVSGTSISAVADGTVTAGSEEYGFSAAGTESGVSGDVAVAASTLVSSSSGPITNSATVMTFKASMSSATTPGSHSQTVAVSASANI